MSDWPLDLDGDRFWPVRESWIEHGVDRDCGSQRIYAVSAASVSPKMLRIRYAHPRTYEVAVYTAGATRSASGDGYIPSNLKDPGRNWARSLVPPYEVEPVDVMRQAEIEAFETLWSERIGIDGHRRAVADGGEW